MMWVLLVPGGDAYAVEVDVHVFAPNRPERLRSPVFDAVHRSGEVVLGEEADLGTLEWMRPELAADRTKVEDHAVERDPGESEPHTVADAQ